MLEYKRPTTLRGLRGFLGLMSYYRKFIKDFAEIAAPLFAITKQTCTGKSQRQLKKEATTPWTEDLWGEEQQKAFETQRAHSCADLC